MNLAKPAESIRSPGKDVTGSEDLASSHLAALHAYWSSKRGERPLPSRQDLDPLELPASLLPHLALLDVEATSGRLRCRLVGTHIVAQFGSDTTGRFLDDVVEPFQAPVTLAALAKSVARDGRAQRLEGWLSRPDGGLRAFECLALPLARDGRTVDMILCGLHALERQPHSCPDLRHAARYPG